MRRAVRHSIVDNHLHLQGFFAIGYYNPGAEGQAFVGGGETILSKNSAAGCSPSLKFIVVKGGRAVQLMGFLSAYLGLRW
jgi:hypothetical protein